MKNFKFLPSSHVEEIKDYPFGRYRTTGTAFLEFSPKKGFRFVRQLRDPKTGRLCAPKKSTYHEIALPIINENNHFSYANFDLNRTIEEVPGVYKSISDNWHLWNQEQQEYILLHALVMVKVKIHAVHVYTGLNETNGVQLNELLPVFEPAIRALKNGLKDLSSNPLKNCSFDFDLYFDLLKRVPENYSPFKVTHYQHNLNTGKFEQVPG